MLAIEIVVEDHESDFEWAAVAVVVDADVVARSLDDRQSRDVDDQSHDYVHVDRTLVALIVDRDRSFYLGDDESLRNEDRVEAAQSHADVVAARNLDVGRDPNVFLDVLDQSPDLVVADQSLCLEIADRSLDQSPDWSYRSLCRAHRSAHVADDVVDPRQSFPCAYVGVRRQSVVESYSSH